MPITLLDGIVTIVVLISAGLAMVRGFTREVLSIASWVIAAAATYYTWEAALPVVQQQIDNEIVALAATVGGIFVVVLILVSYITMRISDWILDSRIGALDRALGFVFGAARGLLLLVVAYIFFDFFVLEDKAPTWIAEAKSKPVLKSLGDQLQSYMPDETAGELINQIKERIEGGTSN